MNKVNTFQLKIIRNTLFFSTLLFSLLFFNACQKEEKLEPNEDAGLLQTPNYDGSGLTGGRNGSGSGGSGGGSANLPSQYFNYEVDGVPVTSTSPFYQSSFISILITNSVSSPSNILQISFNNEPKDTIYSFPGFGNSLSYIESASTGISYEPINGQMTVDSVSSAIIIGTFSCDAASSSGDTVALRNGAFLVHR
tara:strand:- start:304 stop:888 length:585 start_codon:yes stop_codon:yes gene_type:complete